MTIGSVKATLDSGA